MDKLKAYIETEATEIPMGDLPEGAFERFAQRLEQEEAREIVFEEEKRETRFLKYRPLFLPGMIAASVALLLGLSVFWIGEVPTDTPYAVSNEIQELTFYYEMQRNELMANLETIRDNRRNPEIEELFRESRILLSESHIFKQQEVPELPNSDEGIQVVRLHYEQQLQTLEYILEQMKSR